MKNKNRIIIILIIATVLGIAIGAVIYKNNKNNVKITNLENIEVGTWQAEVKFPDWKGYIDDTLAMNSMYSFNGVKDQGKLFFTIGKDVESFDLFINNKKVDTKNMKEGIYELDISKIAVNGINTLQVSNIEPNNLEEAITVNIPYPEIVKGELRRSRIK